jgi:hypothetical protein
MSNLLTMCEQMDIFLLNVIKTFDISSFNFIDVGITHKKIYQQRSF